MSIEEAIIRIQETKDNSDAPEIIESSEAALTTLDILFGLGFKEVSLEEDTDG